MGQEVGQEPPSYPPTPVFCSPFALCTSRDPLGSSNLVSSLGFCGQCPPWVCAHLPFLLIRCWDSGGAALALGLTAFSHLSQQVKLEEFGRPKIDGELKVRSIVNHTKQDR